MRTRMCRCPHLQRKHADTSWCFCSQTAARPTSPSHASAALCIPSMYQRALRRLHPGFAHNSPFFSPLQHMLINAILQNGNDCVGLAKGKSKKKTEVRGGWMPDKGLRNARGTKHHGMFEYGNIPGYPCNSGSRRDGCEVQKESTWGKGRFAKNACMRMSRSFFFSLCEAMRASRECDCPAHVSTLQAQIYQNCIV